MIKLKQYEAPACQIINLEIEDAILLTSIDYLYDIYEGEKWN